MYQCQYLKRMGSGLPFNQYSGDNEQITLTFFIWYHATVLHFLMLLCLKRKDSDTTGNNNEDHLIFFHMKLWYILPEYRFAINNQL